MTGAPTSDSTVSDVTETGQPASETADDDGGDAEPVDPEVAAARIRDRATEIRDREVETALSKLDASGDLSAEDREAVAALADRLVGRLIAVPVEGLQAATATEGGAANGDGEESGRAAAETALELFG